MIRELDLSRITLRLVEEVDKKGEGDNDHIKARLVGETITVLRQALVGNDHYRLVYASTDCVIPSTPRHNSLSKTKRVTRARSRSVSSSCLSR